MYATTSSYSSSPRTRRSRDSSLRYTGCAPTYASGESTHHQSSGSPSPEPQSRSCSYARSVWCWSSSEWSMANGTRPQVQGFQSIGSSPRLSAATWKAQPNVPVGPSPRLANTQAPSWSFVCLEPEPLPRSFHQFFLYCGRRSQSSLVSCLTRFFTRSKSSAPSASSAEAWMKTPDEQQPVFASPWMPLQPQPKMHFQALDRNVRSICHVDASRGSMKVAHSL